MKKRGKGGTAITDEQLIWEIRSGNHSAYKKLVVKYQNYVFSIVYSIVRDQGDAEDVSQETFLQIFRSLPQYRGEGMKSWIGRIAARKAIDWKRKTKNRNREHSWELEQEGNSPYPSKLIMHEGILSQLLTTERKEAITSLLETLPHPYKRTVFLYYMEDKTYQEISELEGVSVKTVESRLYRAKQLLRDKWKEGV